MAKKIEINSSLQSNFAKTDQSRVGVRELKAFFLIVCEGEKTEPNYFKSFPKMASNIVFDLQFDGGGISTTKVLEKAIKIRDTSSLKFDRIWIVFDKDSFPDVKFNKAILDADKEGIKSAWSNEAFELWYLLHFVYRNTGMKREEYQKTLETQINAQIKLKTGKAGNFKYKKNDAGMYKSLQEYGSETNAIKWSEALNTANGGQQYAKYNPCTTVYKLVCELRGLSKELNAEIVEKHEKGE
ncbi:MAG: hypothetical protein H6Q69_2872 [Firmicutes bacterium]|nr:hypothetical protein [Bacillota bacterium]